MLETGDEAQWITKTRKRRGHLPLLAILHRERERERDLWQQGKGASNVAC